MDFQLIASGSKKIDTSTAGPFLYCDLPTGTRIGGQFPVAVSDYRTLTSTMVDFSLPNGVVLDVGWYPDRDPDGEFIITVFKGDWNNTLQSDWNARSINDLTKKVSFLAAFWERRNTVPLTDQEEATQKARYFRPVGRGTPFDKGSTDARKQEVYWDAGGRPGRFVPRFSSENQPQTLVQA